MAKFIEFQIGNATTPLTRIHVEDITGFCNTDATSLVIHLKGGKKIDCTTGTDDGSNVTDLLNGIKKCMELAKAPYHEDRALVTTITLTNIASSTINATIS